MVKLKNVTWLPKKRRFAAVVNRLQWEEGGKTRVRAGLHFDGVLKVQSQQGQAGRRRGGGVDLLAVTLHAEWRAKIPAAWSRSCWPAAAPSA